MQSIKSLNNTKLLWISLKKENNLINFSFLFRPSAFSFWWHLCWSSCSFVNWIRWDGVCQVEWIFILDSSALCLHTEYVDQNDLKISLAVSSGKRTHLTHQCLALNIKYVFNKHKSIFLVMLCSSAGDHVFWLLEVMADSLTSFTLTLLVIHWIIGMLMYMTFQLFVVATVISYYCASTNIKNIFLHRAYQATITVIFLM